MKKTRKLIPAIAMLLMSTVMMSTASFAWFSMNKTVTATNMKVTATSDAANLVIVGGTENITATTTSTSKDAELGGTLYPITPAVTLTSSNIATSTSWKYAYSTSISDGMAGVDDDAYTSLKATDNLLLDTDDDTKDYVAKVSYKIGLQNTTGGLDKVSNLKLTGLTFTNANAGIVVVVVCGTNLYTHSTAVSNGTEVLAAEVSKTTPATVDVYIYIDGDDNKVTTNNLENLNGTVALTFSCE